MIGKDEELAAFHEVTSLVDKYSVRSSRSKVMYRVVTGLSYFEKLEIGHHSSNLSEASAMMLVGASGFGCKRRVALARASFKFCSGIIATWYALLVFLRG